MSTAIPFGHTLDGLPVEVTLAGTPLAFVGPTGSAKSNVLRTVAQGALAAGHRVVVIEPVYEALDYCRSLRAAVLAGSLDAAVTALEAAMKNTQPTLVLIDNLEWILWRETAPEALSQQYPRHKAEMDARNAERAVVQSLIEEILGDPASPVRLVVAVQRPAPGSAPAAILSAFQPVMLVGAPHRAPESDWVGTLGDRITEAVAAITPHLPSGRGLGVIEVDGVMTAFRATWTPDVAR